MTPAAALQIDIATPADLDAIRQIIHRTFAEEIPQHDPRPDGRLVDKFEDETIFIVARSAGEIVGMLALRDRRPFSLDGKVANLDRFLPPHRRPCELRLLSVAPSRRQGVVLRGLMARMLRECDSRGFDIAVLSATTRQLRLYGHLGCVPFGELVGTADAPYQPMYLTRRALMDHVGDLLAPPGPHCFQTGPVSLSEAVRARLAARPTSHRGEAFAADLSTIRDTLRALVGARRVAVFAGSGTLANDAVAAQMAAAGGRVLVTTNGEFGDRLVDHARRNGLDHVVFKRPWGAPFDGDALRQAMRQSGARWVWAVHCETSTGMLNDLDLLRGVAADHGARLALDAASSAGAAEFSLDGVALAATVSGKALGAVAGLAIVCTAERPARLSRAAPRYLDLAQYLDGDGVPFTQSSLLVGALAESLRSTNWPLRFRDIADGNQMLRERMAAVGVRPLVDGSAAAPAVATWPVPPDVGSAAVGAELERAGFEISWQSGYLRDRNWVQTALFGAFPVVVVPPLATALAAAITRRPAGQDAESQSSDGSSRARSMSAPRESMPSF